MSAEIIELRGAHQPAPAISPTLWAAAEILDGARHLVLAARLDEEQVGRRLELAHLADQLADVCERLADLAAGDGGR